MITQITIANNLIEIEKAIDFFKQFAVNSNVIFSDIQRLCVVLDEVLSNIICYGYADDKDHEILVGFNKENNEINIDIVDDGIMFNPLLMKNPDLNQGSNNIPGGMGIHLIKNLVDDISYQRIDEKNHLTLKKYVHEL